MCGSQRLFFGTAARLEEPRVNNHLAKATLVDNPAAHLLPEWEKRNKEQINLLFSIPSVSVQMYGLTGTFSSMIDPKMRRWREWSVSVWTQCQIHHQTGYCNWATEQETHWRLCCGHQSLPKKNTHPMKDLFTSTETLLKET